MKVPLGKYFIGHETVEVFADTEREDAQAQLPGTYPGGRKVLLGQIIVGIKAQWWHVIDNYWHEVTEYYAARFGMRLEPITVSHDSSNCTFVMTHPQFTQMITVAADFHCVIVDKVWDCYRANEARLRRLKKNERKKTKNRKAKGAAKASLSLDATLPARSYLTSRAAD